MNEAPDIIYAEVNDNGFVGGYAVPMKKDDVEYIRKDALIAWMYDRQELEFDDIIEEIKAL